MRASQVDSQGVAVHSLRVTTPSQAGVHDHKVSTEYTTLHFSSRNILGSQQMNGPGWGFFSRRTHVIWHSLDANHFQNITTRDLVYICMQLTELLSALC